MFGKIDQNEVHVYRQKNLQCLSMIFKANENSALLNDFAYKLNHKLLRINADNAFETLEMNLSRNNTLTKLSFWALKKAVDRDYKTLSSMFARHGIER
jgi:hypothetical protein